MKKILIYGDSNVWGDNFYTNKRIDDCKQWPIILEKNLKNEYKIIQEGLPGRLAGDEEKTKKYKNGKDTFIAVLKTQSPIDIIIIMLGTNDLQTKYNKSEDKTIKDLLWYKETIEEDFKNDETKIKYYNNKLPNILYILPPNFNAKEVFDDNAEKKRQSIINYFEKNNINHIKINNMPLFEDNIHLNYEGHEILANLVERKITNDNK